MAVVVVVLAKVLLAAPLQMAVALAVGLSLALRVRLIPVVAVAVVVLLTAAPAAPESWSSAMPARPIWLMVGQKQRVQARPLAIASTPLQTRVLRPLASTLLTSPLPLPVRSPVVVR